jgi:hypothetical protein
MATVAVGIFSSLVHDAGLVEAVAQRPVAPTQVVVVVGARVQQDARQFPEIV